MWSETSAVTQAGIVSSSQQQEVVKVCDVSVSAISCHPTFQPARQSSIYNTHTAKSNNQTI